MIYFYSFSSRKKTNLASFNVQDTLDAVKSWIWKKAVVIYKMYILLRSIMWKIIYDVFIFQAGQMDIPGLMMGNVDYYPYVFYKITTDLIEK